MPAVVVAPLETKPPKTASPPSESEERRSEEVKVELAMLMRPPEKPVMVEVATPYSVALKGKVLARVMGDAPRTVKEVQETEPPQEAEVVATPYTPAAPFDTRRLLEDGWEVVASPVQGMVALLPPTRAPRAEVPPKGPLKASVVVATPATPAPPVEYKRFEIDGWLVVARPLQVTVFAFRISGVVKERGDS